MPEKTRTSPWVLGCGIGCGLLVLAVVGIFTAGSIFIGRTVSGFRGAVQARDQIDERFGPASEFVPPPDGSIPAARIEAFLRVRDSIADEQHALAETFSKLPMDRRAAEELDAKPFSEKLVQVFGIARSAMGLGIEAGSFFQARNEAMLEAGLGMGEYTWIYAIAYWSWLGHSPDDGPGAGRDDDQPSDEGDNIRMTSPVVRSRIHDELTAMLENQLAALPPDANGAWREALSAEVDAMRDDSQRVPWQDGLPPVVSDSLEPYRERLEATYNRATAALELARNRKRGNWSFTAD